MFSPWRRAGKKNEDTKRLKKCGNWAVRRGIQEEPPFLLGSGVVGELFTEMGSTGGEIEPCG